MGIEPMTFSLQDWRSTTKLRCPYNIKYSQFIIP